MNLVGHISGMLKRILSQLLDRVSPFYREVSEEMHFFEQSMKLHEHRETRDKPTTQTDNKHAQRLI